MESKTHIMEKIETIIGTYHASRCAYEDDGMEDEQDQMIEIVVDMVFDAPYEGGI